MGNELVRVRDPESLEVWAKRIQECERSGISVVTWCGEHSINVKTYYYWHNKLNKQAKHSEPEFYRIGELPISSSGIAVSIRFGTVTADVYSGADENTLKAVFQLLERC